MRSARTGGDSDGEGTRTSHGGGQLEPPVTEQSVGQLVGEIKDQLTLLIKKQVELAKVEVRSNLRSEVTAAGGLLGAGLAGLVAVTLLLVTAILALATVMPAWAAGLLVTGVVLAVAAGVALYGWHKRVRSPLAATRQMLREDIRWTKRRLA